MKIEDVALFERVAALGSVSEAGRALDLSATVASERLARLERVLGSTLAHRTTRSLTLTDDGRRFLERARALLQVYDETRESVGSRSQEPSGRVHFTAPAYFGRLFLGPVVQRFLADYPKVSLKLSLSDTVANYIGDGVDIALRIGGIPDSTFRARKLSVNHRLLCASQDYVAKRGLPKTPEDLAHHDCLVLGGETRWRFIRGGVRSLTTVQAKVDTDSAEFVKTAVIAGLGIAERSLWDVAQDLLSGNLVQVLPEYEVDHDMAIWLLFPPGRYRSLATQAFADVLSGDLKQAMTGVQTLRPAVSQKPGS